MRIIRGKIAATRQRPASERCHRTGLEIEGCRLEAPSYSQVGFPGQKGILLVPHNPAGHKPSEIKDHLYDETDRIDQRLCFHETSQRNIWTIAETHQLSREEQTRRRPKSGLVLADKRSVPETIPRFKSSSWNQAWHKAMVATQRGLTL